MDKLKKNIKKDIHDAIGELISNFVSSGVSVKDVVKFFKRKDKITMILKNINYVGFEHFNSDMEYENYVKKELKDILEDTNALDRDTIRENHLIVSYNVFESIIDLED